MDGGINRPSQGVVRSDTQIILMIYTKKRLKCTAFIINSLILVYSSDLL